jgi:hypothetical protein
MNSDSTPLTVTGNAEQRVSYLEWRNISHHHTQSFFPSDATLPPPLRERNDDGRRSDQRLDQAKPSSSSVIAAPCLAATRFMPSEAAATARDGTARAVVPRRGTR